jgi:arylsulfatase A-like enzyme
LRRSISFGYAVVCGLLAAGFLACDPAPAPEPAAPPAGGLFLISIEALRADRVGAERPASGTPALDALAARSVRFVQAFSGTPRSVVAHAALFSGRSDPSAGAQTFAEALRAAGYRSAGFVGSPLDGAAAVRGFESWSAGAGDAERASAALGWLASLEPQTPFLLFVHLDALRCPDGGDDPCAVRPGSWPAPGPARRARISGYGATLARVDAVLARLLAGVAGRRPRGVHVVLAAPAGYAFGEHGTAGAGASLHVESVRVPLLVDSPGFHAMRIAEPVSLLDVVPTVLELLGLSGSDVEGRSLARAMRGDPPPAARRALHGRLDAPASRSVLFGLNHLIRDLDSGAEELYDYVADPRERRNLIDRGVARRAVLTRKLEAGLRADEEAAAP